MGEGVRFCALTVVDVFTRKSVAIEMAQRLRGKHTRGDSAESTHPNVETMLKRHVGLYRGRKMTFLYWLELALVNTLSSH